MPTDFDSAASERTHHFPSLSPMHRQLQTVTPSCLNVMAKRNITVAKENSLSYAACCHSLY
jgi:hypothetical protein